jgi:hypothetical protein
MLINKKQFKTNCEAHEVTIKNNQPRPEIINRKEKKESIRATHSKLNRL